MGSEISKSLLLDVQIPSEFFKLLNFCMKKQTNKQKKTPFLTKLQKCLDFFFIFFIILNVNDFFPASTVVMSVQLNIRTKTLMVVECSLYLLWRSTELKQYIRKVT